MTRESRARRSSCSAPASSKVACPTEWRRACLACRASVARGEGSGRAIHGAGPARTVPSRGRWRFSPANGLPEAAIRQETASLSTWENGAISAPLLRGWGFERLSDRHRSIHMRRASAVFTRLGFDVRRASVPIGEGHDDNVSMLRAGIREFLGLGYYWLRGRTGLPDPATSPGSITVAPKHAVVNTGPVVVLGRHTRRAGSPARLAACR